MEGSNDSGQKERESKSNRRRNSHARVVGVDGWGVVPGESPHQVQSKSKYPKDGRAHGRKSCRMCSKYVLRPGHIQKVLTHQQYHCQGQKTWREKLSQISVSYTFWETYLEPLQSELGIHMSYQSGRNCRRVGVHLRCSKRS